MCSAANASAAPSNACNINNTAGVKRRRRNTENAEAFGDVEREVAGGVHRWDCTAGSGVVGSGGDWGDGTATGLTR